MPYLAVDQITGNCIKILRVLNSLQARKSLPQSRFPISGQACLANCSDGLKVSGHLAGTLDIRLSRNLGPAATAAHLLASGETAVGLFVPNSQNKCTSDVLERRCVKFLNLSNCSENLVMNRRKPLVVWAICHRATH